MQHKARGARHEGTDARILLPGQVVHPVGDQPLHQDMPGGVKANVVQPLAGGVVAQQLRRVGIGQAPQLQRLLGAELLAQRGQYLGIPAALLALQRFAQRRIGEKQVAVAQRLGLVKNGVRSPDHESAP